MLSRSARGRLMAPLRSSNSATIRSSAARCSWSSTGSQGAPSKAHCASLSSNSPVRKICRPRAPVSNDVGYRLPGIAGPAKAMRHRLVEYQQVARRQRQANACMRHHEVDLGEVERKQPEQAARPMAADVVVKARAARCQVIDARGHAAPVVREIASQHARQLQGAGDVARQVGHVGRRGGQVGQRGGGVVDVRESLDAARVRRLRPPGWPASRRRETPCARCAPSHRARALATHAAARRCAPQRIRNGAGTACTFAAMTRCERWRGVRGHAVIVAMVATDAQHAVIAADAH